MAAATERPGWRDWLGDPLLGLAGCAVAALVLALVAGAAPGAWLVLAGVVAAIGLSGSA